MSKLNLDDSIFGSDTGLDELYDIDDTDDAMLIGTEPNVKIEHSNTSDKLTPKQDKALLFMKDRIREKINLIKNRMSDMKYRLYTIKIDSAKTIDEVRAISEIQSQLDFIEYLKKIDTQIKSLDTNVDDIEQTNLKDSAITRFSIIEPSSNKKNVKPSIDTIDLLNDLNDEELFNTMLDIGDKQEENSKALGYYDDDEDEVDEDTDSEFADFDDEDDPLGEFDEDEDEEDDSDEFGDFDDEDYDDSMFEDDDGTDSEFADFDDDDEYTNSMFEDDESDEDDSSDEFGDFEEDTDTSDMFIDDDEDEDDTDSEFADFDDDDEYTNSMFEDDDKESDDSEFGDFEDESEFDDSYDDEDEDDIDSEFGDFDDNDDSMFDEDEDSDDSMFSDFDDSDSEYDEQYADYDDEDEDEFSTDTDEFDPDNIFDDDDEDSDFEELDEEDNEFEDFDDDSDSDNMFEDFDDDEDDTNDDSSEIRETSGSDFEDFDDFDNTFVNRNVQRQQNNQSSAIRKPHNVNRGNVFKNGSERGEKTQKTFDSITRLFGGASKVAKKAGHKISKTSKNSFFDLDSEDNKD